MYLILLYFENYVFLCLHNFDNVCFYFDRLLLLNNPLRGHHLPLIEGKEEGSTNWARCDGHGASTRGSDSDRCGG